MSKQIIVDTGIKKEVLDIPISSIDDLETIKIKVANQLDIPYNFLILDDNETIKKESEVKMSIPFKTITKIITLSEIQEMNISFRTINKVIFENKKENLNVLRKLVKYFIKKANPSVNDKKYFIQVMFYYLFNKPQNAEFLNKPESKLFTDNYSLAFEFISFINDYKEFGSLLSFILSYEGFIKKLKYDIEEVKTKNKDIRYIQDFIRSNKEKAKSVQSEFSKERIKYVNSKIVLSPFEIDEMELFERIKLSRDVPYCKKENFNKILKSFIPPDQLLEEKSNKLVMYVLLKKNEPISNVENPKDYNYSKIYINKNGNSLEIFVESKLEGVDYNFDVKEETIIERIINALDIKTKLSSIDCKIYPQYFKGEIYFPLLTISRIAMHDIIMNNEFISKMFVTSERFTTFNKKGGVSIIYIPSENENTEETSMCSMTNSFVNSTNKRFIKGTSLRLGDNFLSISFRTKNEYSLSLLKECLSHLISVYNNEEKEILKIYSSYDYDYKEEKKEIDKIDKILEKTKVSKKELKLRDYVPELFVANYPAVCGKQPVIIENEKEAEEKIKKGVDIMKYPLYNEFDQYYYSCENNSKNGYIYPGLKKSNIVDNLIPCCFSTKQGKDSKRRKYEEGEEEEEEEKKKVTGFKIYKTAKIMPVGGLGYLAQNIEKLFNVLDSDNSYFRYGVNIGINSCIEAIMRCVEDPKKINNMNKKERETMLSKKRLELKKYILKGASSQESYMYSLDSIKTYLEQEKFLDIRLFKDALQDMFDCYIYIFQVNKDNPNGEFISSYYTNNLYLLSKKRKYRYTIFLYETMGTRIDNIYYPHYEYIVRYKPRSNKITSTFSNDEIVVSIKQTFDKIYMNHKKQIKTKIEKIPFVTSIKSQKADSFGKIRMISFSNDVTIFIQPIDSIPTNNLEENVNYTELIPIEYDTALKFLKDEKVNDYKFSVIEENIVGIIAKKGSLRFYISIIPTPKTNSQMTETSVTPVPSNILEENIIETYSKRLKSSRNISAVSLYLFSKYINATNKSIRDDDLEETIDSFTKDKIKVDNNLTEFSYGEFPRKFSNISQIIENKLTLHNKKMVKKIMYYLFIKTKQNSEYVKEYYDLEFIPNYYEDVRDFKPQQESLIFTNNQSIKSWKKILSSIQKTIVHNSITSDMEKEMKQRNTILFSNKNITNDDLYIGVKANNLYSALSFFDNLKFSGIVNFNLLKQDDLEPQTMFKGSIISINDAEGKEKNIKKYGKDDNIILIYKEDGLTKIICLFKYYYSYL